MLEVVHKLISNEKNLYMTRPPRLEEVKEVVFGMSKESTSGSDGFSGAFVQVYWDIIKEDIVRMVMTFFCGSELPKFVTHRDMVLIQRKERITSFNDLKPNQS